MGQSSSSARSASAEPASKASGAAAEKETTQAAQTGGSRSSAPVVRSTAALGKNVLGNSYAEVDASAVSEGYICVRSLAGGSQRIKVLVSKGSGNTYQYNLNTDGNYEVFPLSEGDGTYSVGVYQNVSGTSYAQLFATDIQVDLNSSFAPFLRPNQYVNYSAGSNTVAKGQQLAKSASSDLAVVQNVYNYVVKNISYDYGKASSVTSGYLPRVDHILSCGQGICFDYAAVMATMLRTQNIPTKLVVGYSGKIYHAWISTYITDVGWVNGIIYFDGANWKRMDPTFASSEQQSDRIMKYIENSSNYNPMYFY